MFHFANLLFSGPCNARCPDCIGKQIDPRRAPPNLDEYPPRGLDRFLGLIRQHGIREVVLTGANTDPLLYRPLARLLDDLRAGLPAGTRLGLHSNGRLALARIDLVRRFDKLCLSVPSFDPVIYRAAMGVEGVPDVGAIMDQSGLPVKLSCLVTEINRVEVPEYLERCRELGARRVVLRKRFGERRDWSELLPGRWEDPLEVRFGNPVYERMGVQVTLWDFEQAQIRSLNLFSSGEISAEYLLAGERSETGYVTPTVNASYVRHSMIFRKPNNFDTAAFQIFAWSPTPACCATRCQTTQKIQFMSGEGGKISQK